MLQDENELKNLAALFAKSPEEGISQAKLYLMSPNFVNYDEFIEDVKKTQKSNTCIVSWAKSMLSARCLDCQLQENSCICIPCYLAGKHDQHHSYLIGGSGSGNCDCGDPNFWKPEGNCPHHQGPDPNPEVTQMTTENRTKFINVFKIAYNSAITTDNDTFSIQIFEWISSFISFGDGLRRCVAIAVVSSPEQTFITKLQQLEEGPLNSLIDLFGKLVSDHFFGEKMGSFTLKNYLLLRNIIKTELFKDDYDVKSIPFHPIKKYLNFSFHFFNKIPLNYMISEFNFNWVDFIINCLKFSLETVKEMDMNETKNSDGQITSQLWYLSKLLNVLVQIDDQHDNIQRFIDSYSTLLLDHERFYSFTYSRTKENETGDPYTPLYLFINLYQINVIFGPKSEVSQKNKTFSIDVTFSNLVKYLTSENDIKPMSLYGKEPVRISSFLPLHHLFYCILSSHTNPLHVLQEVCSKNNFSMNQFCLLSSICPLRILAAIYVPDRFGFLSKASHRHITYCIDRPEETFNIFFGLVQTNLFALADEDELFSMIVETFGVYQDYQVLPTESTDKRRFMTEMMNYNNQLEFHQSSWFDASIFIVSLITDKSIRTFDKVLFKRLRVIELLMNQKPSAKDIENFIGDKLSNPIFGDDLQSFAERVNSSKGSFFKLKEEQNEFTPFFPVIYRKNRMKILMKYTNKLAPVPDFNQTDLIHLSFKSPTFFVAMYNCIVNKSLMFNQVGLIMFILSARNGAKYDFESDIINDQQAINPDSISDLVQKIAILFKKDQNFNPFLLKIKLPLSNVCPSIIDVIQSMENLGYEALTKTDLPASLRPKIESDDGQIQKEKKELAANFKQTIMKEFQKRRSQFAMGSITKSAGDENELELDEKNHSQSKTSEFYCNICQINVEYDIFVFPCLSLPCILPSLINNKLHKLDFQLDKLERVFSFSICLHPVHRRCSMNLIKEFINDRGKKNVNHIYHCMMDRSIKNCFLPLFSDSNFNFTVNHSPLLKETIKSFMKMAFDGIDALDNPIIPINSFAGCVLLLEVRHRSRPECLDNPSVPFLLHNLLLTFYVYLHKNLPLCELDVNQYDPLTKLVFMLIISETPIDDHKKFVKQIAESLDDDYLYEFLRRAAIIEDFAFKIDKSDKDDSKKKFIDWDEILSFESLVERYDIKINDNKLTIELPLFETIPLAERFVSLYQPPYNMDIFDASFTKFVDLLTGKIVFFSKDELQIPGKPEIPHITTYVSEIYHEGIAMFLSLTGPNASDIIISCPKFGQIYAKESFYVDQFGDIDSGFKRGAILSLSKDRLENALDKLLSGD